MWPLDQHPHCMPPDVLPSIDQINTCSTFFDLTTPITEVASIQAACGALDHLLALLCQLAELQARFPLPHDFEVWGMASSISYAMSDADYGQVH